MQSPFTTKKSFESTFKAYYPNLVAFAYKYIPDINICEDLVQELFIDLFEKKDQLRIKNSVKPYLFQSMHNRCISYLRKQKTIEKNESQIKLSDYDEFRDTLVEVEFEYKVYQEINKLPEKCREIFMLSRFEDFSNEEIAQKLKISKRTVETQVSKALKILRESLSPKALNAFFL